MKLKDVNSELFEHLPDDIEKNEKTWKEVSIGSTTTLSIHT